ncbi:hypothetical protein [Dehalobacter sp. 4CP]
MNDNKKRKKGDHEDGKDIPNKEVDIFKHISAARMWVGHIYGGLDERNR